MFFIFDRDKLQAWARKLWKTKTHHLHLWTCKIFKLWILPVILKTFGVTSSDRTIKTNLKVNFSDQFHRQRSVMPIAQAFSVHTQSENEFYIFHIWSQIYTQTRSHTSSFAGWIACCELRLDKCVKWMLNDHFLPHISQDGLSPFPLMLYL